MINKGKNSLSINKEKIDLNEKIKEMSVEDFKVECYDCGKRYMPDEMTPVEIDGGTEFLCKYCN